MPKSLVGCAPLRRYDLPMLNWLVTVAFTLTLFEAAAFALHWSPLIAGGFGFSIGSALGLMFSR